MADGILGLGTGQASTLSQDLIDKLKEAERTATVVPIEDDLDAIDIETETISSIKSLVSDFLATVEPFDLFITSGVNVFDEKSATTTGESAIFDATDVGSLNSGTTTVTVSQLAQKDVYQTITFSDPTDIVSSSSATLSINGYDFTLTGKTYEEVAEQISYNSKFNASVEQVGDSSYRLVIKSEETGTANALEITETGIDLGLSDFKSATTITSTADVGSGLSLVIDGNTFTTDDATDSDSSGTISYEEFINYIDAHADYESSIDADGYVTIRRVDGTALDITTDDLGLNFSNENHTLTAQNLLATVDGVAYNISSNNITVEGNLQITAVSTGTSAISIEKDTSQIQSMFELMIDAYNTLMTAIDDELYADDSSVEDKASLRNIQSQIKDFFFKDYGTTGDLNLFAYGLEIDKSGTLSLNATTFSTAVSEDFDNLKLLFIGVAESEGFGTQLKEFVDSLDGYDGLISTYEDGITTRQENLEAELEKAEEDLDNKYSALSEQFAECTALITKFNAQFASLEMMIQQSVTSS